MPFQRHSVVIPRDDGGVEVYPLKEWLRKHPDEVPPGLDATSAPRISCEAACVVQAGLWREHQQRSGSSPRAIKNGREIVGDIFGSEQDASEQTDEPSFSLESQLRDFIASNLNSIPIDGRRLRLFVDATGRDGIEFPSAVGPIDILAVDSEGSFFVFELKRANSSDRIIGQLARYMGWIKQTIGRDHKVFGIVVAQSVSDNLRYAASAMPDVRLFEYGVEFHLRPAHTLEARSDGVA
jgi:endonuclease